jgi:hypothetical protein
MGHAMGSILYSTKWNIEATTVAVNHALAHGSLVQLLHAKPGAPNKHCISVCAKRAQESELKDECAKKIM